MIRTATALTRAWTIRGSGPNQAQATNVMTATQNDRRHEVRRDLVGQTLNRRAGPLRLAHHADDLGEHRLGPDALGPHHQAAGAVDRAADHAVARAFLHRDRLAADHRFVDRASALDHDAVDRDFLAGPDAQPIARDDLLERHVSFS